MLSVVCVAYHTQCGANKALGKPYCPHGLAGTDRFTNVELHCMASSGLPEKNLEDSEDAIMSSASQGWKGLGCRVIQDFLLHNSN